MHRFFGLYIYMGDDWSKAERMAWQTAIRLNIAGRESSGVVIGPHMILTAAHCLTKSAYNRCGEERQILSSHPKFFRLWRPARTQKISAAYAEFDEEADIAIIVTRTKLNPPYAIPLKKEIAKGCGVICPDLNAAAPAQFFAGFRQPADRREEGHEYDEDDYHIFHMKVAHGNSGSGIFDARTGHLASVISSIPLENEALTMGTSAAYIREFTEQVQEKYAAFFAALDAGMPTPQLSVR